MNLRLSTNITLVALLVSFATAANPEFEKYRATMIAQWKEFRANPETKKGTKVKWAIKLTKVNPIHDDPPSPPAQVIIGNLDTNERRYTIAVVVTEFATPTLSFKIDDWVIVEGVFDGVNENGVVMIHRSRATNRGYRGDGNSPE